MKQNYTINTKHFSPMNHPAWRYRDIYVKEFNVHEDQDLLFAYCSNSNIMSLLIFDYEKNKIDEYDIHTRDLLATHYSSDLSRLKPMVSFFKESIFIPTLNRHETVKVLLFSFRLQDQNYDIGPLYFLQEAEDPKYVWLYNSQLDFNYQHSTENSAKIYCDLFEYFNFKVLKVYGDSIITFMNKGNRIDVDYHSSASKQNILYPKQVSDYQRTVSFHIDYDNKELSNQYIEQCINVLIQLMNSSKPDVFLRHIKLNHYFLHWFKEEESNLSDNPSK